MSQNFTASCNLHPRNYFFWWNSSSANSLGVDISVPWWRTNALGSSNHLLIRFEKNPIKKPRIHIGMNAIIHSIIFLASPEEVALQNEFWM